MLFVRQRQLRPVTAQVVLTAWPKLRSATAAPGVTRVALPHLAQGIPMRRSRVREPSARGQRAATVRLSSPPQRTSQTHRMSGAAHVAMWSTKGVDLTTRGRLVSQLDIHCSRTGYQWRACRKPSRSRVRRNSSRKSRKERYVTAVAHRPGTHTASDCCGLPLHCWVVVTSGTLSVVGCTYRIRHVLQAVHVGVSSALLQAAPAWPVHLPAPMPSIGCACSLHSPAVA